MEYSSGQKRKKVLTVIFLGLALLLAVFALVLAYIIQTRTLSPDQTSASENCESLYQSCMASCSTSSDKRPDNTCIDQYKCGSPPPEVDCQKFTEDDNYKCVAECNRDFRSDTSKCTQPSESARNKCIEEENNKENERKACILECSRKVKESNECPKKQAQRQAYEQCQKQLDQCLADYRNRLSQYNAAQAQRGDFCRQQCGSEKQLCQSGSSSKTSGGGSNTQGNSASNRVQPNNGQKTTGGGAGGAGSPNQAGSQPATGGSSGGGADSGGGGSSSSGPGGGGYSSGSGSGGGSSSIGAGSGGGGSSSSGSGGGGYSSDSGSGGGAGPVGQTEYTTCNEFSFTTSGGKSGSQGRVVYSGVPEPGETFDFYSSGRSWPPNTTYIITFRPINADVRDACSYYTFAGIPAAKDTWKMPANGVTRADSSRILRRYLSTEPEWSQCAGTPLDFSQGFVISMLYISPYWCSPLELNGNGRLFDNRSGTLVRRDNACVNKCYIQVNPRQSQQTTPITTVTTTVTQPVASVTQPITTVTQPITTVTQPVTTVTQPVTTVTQSATSITQAGTTTGGGRVGGGSSAGGGGKLPDTGINEGVAGVVVGIIVIALGVSLIRRFKSFEERIMKR